jgi:hypothetical protein
VLVLPRSTNPADFSIYPDLNWAAPNPFSFAAGTLFYHLIGEKMSFKDNFIYRKRTKLSIALVFLSGLIAVSLTMVNRPTHVLAEAADLALVRAQYPVMSGSRIDSCNLCHTSSIPSLNPYGAAYKAAGRVRSALVTIQNADTDGDGFSNLAEISALTFPGNASDKPSAPTATRTSVPPTATRTNVPPTATRTNAPATATRTNVPLTATRTSIPPTATRTNAPATATRTNVPATATRTVSAPTATRAAVASATLTSPPATATRTAGVIATRTQISAPATRTITPRPAATRTKTVKPTTTCSKKDDSHEREHEKEDNFSSRRRTPTATACPPTHKKTPVPTRTPLYRCDDDCDNENEKDDLYTGGQPSLSLPTNNSLFDGISTWFDEIISPK